MDHNRSRSTRSDLSETMFTTPQRWNENYLSNFIKNPASSTQMEDRRRYEDKLYSEYLYNSYNNWLEKNKKCIYVMGKNNINALTTITEEQEKDLISRCNSSIIDADCNNIDANCNNNVSNCNNVDVDSKTMSTDDLAAELENRLRESLNLQAALRMKFDENDAMTPLKPMDSERSQNTENIETTKLWNVETVTSKKLIGRKEEEITSTSLDRDSLQQLLDGCLIEYSKYMTTSNAEHLELKRELKEKDELLLKLQTQHEFVSKDNERLKRKWNEYLIGFNKTLSEMNKRTDKLKAELNDNKRTDELKEELCENKKLLSDLQETCKQKTDENDKLKKQLNESTMKLHQKTIEVNEMSAEVDVKENQLSRLHDRFKKMVATHRENEGNLKKKETEVEEMKSLHDREIKTLGDTIDQLKNEKENENFENGEHLRKKILELEKELKLSKDSLLDTSAKHQSIMAALEVKCNNQVNEMKDAFLNLQTQLDAKHKSLQQCILTHKLEKEKLLLECDKQTEMKTKLHDDIIKRKSETTRKLRKELDICKQEMLANNNVSNKNEEKVISNNDSIDRTDNILEWLSDANKASSGNSNSSGSNCSTNTAETQFNDSGSATTDSQVKHLQLKIVELQNNLLAEKKSSTEITTSHNVELKNMKVRYNNRVEEVRRKMKLISEEEMERHYMLVVKIRRELNVCKQELDEKGKTIEALSKKVEYVDRVVFQKNAWLQKCEQLEYGLQKLKKKYEGLKMEISKNKRVNNVELKRHENLITGRDKVVENEYLLMEVE